MMKKKISQFYKIENFVVEQTESQSLGTQGKREKGSVDMWKKNLFKSFLSFSVQIVHTPDFVFRSMYTPLTNQIAHMSLHANV